MNHFLQDIIIIQRLTKVRQVFDQNGLGDRKAPQLIFYCSWPFVGQIKSCQGIKTTICSWHGHLPPTTHYLICLDNSTISLTCRFRNWRRLVPMFNWMVQHIPVVNQKLFVGLILSLIQIVTFIWSKRAIMCTGICIPLSIWSGNN